MHLDIVFVVIATLSFTSYALAGSYPASFHYPNLPWWNSGFGYSGNTLFGTLGAPLLGGGLGLGADLLNGGGLGFGTASIVDGGQFGGGFLARRSGLSGNFLARRLGPTDSFLPGLGAFGGSFLPGFASFGGKAVAQRRPRPRLRSGYGHGSGPNGPYGLYYSFLDPHIGRRRFSQSEAQAACNLRRMRVVSLENPLADQAVSLMIQQFEIPFVWTSGHRRGHKFFWGNNRPIAAFPHGNWSPVGSVSLPQPDNAQGAEYCLAVVNNRYGDGVKWHDLRCDKKLFFVCEPK